MTPTMTPRTPTLCPLLAAALAFLAGPALAETPDYTAGTTYATVKGWTVKQSQDYGCSAYQNARTVFFNTPPAGGWQLIFPANGAPDGQFDGVVDVDKFSFTEEETGYFAEAGWIYSGFPLDMRKTVGNGSTLHAEIGGKSWDAPLTGSTAVLLKLEECWQNLSGWTAATSGRAGTFAFSGD